MIVKHHLLYYLLGTAGTQNGPYGSQLVQSSPVYTNIQIIRLKGVFAKNERGIGLVR